MNLPVQPGLDSHRGSNVSLKGAVLPCKASICLVVVLYGARCHVPLGVTLCWSALARPRSIFNIDEGVIANVASGHQLSNTNEKAMLIDVALFCVAL